MNLIQQLSSAALEATKSQLSSSKAASTPGQQNAHSTATVSALLDQLASSIASIHQHQQQQQQQQQSLDSTAGAGKGLGPTASASDCVHQVQAGLQASNEQLQRLLSQRIRVPLTPPEGAAGAAAFKQAISSPLSLQVLQNLLQLAVGSRCLSCKVQSEPSWQSGQQQQQQQQDDWHRAAWEAVQLFSFQELEQLPPHSLQQALLLHPQLLDSLLEAAAAAVLQPVLQCSTNNVTTSPHTTTITATQQHHIEVNSGSSLHKDSGSEPVAGSGGVQNMQSLLSASCPWVQHLPDMLAQNPLLLLKASSTLLSWFEASGHVRLLQLLSTICRPAWQQLAAAAAEPSQCPANAAVPASAAGRASCSVGGCGMNSQTHKQRMSAGRLELLCPLPWQQQLVMQLAQEPSVEGLLVLLHRLPGLAAAQQPHHHQQQQQQQKTEGGPMEVDGGIGANGTAAAGAAADWTNDELLAWPQPREWGQPAAAAAAQLDQDCSKDQQQQQQQAAVQDRSEMLLAWGLVVQHHCWYQFACALLVRSSLQHVQHCQHCHQQQQQQDWTTMVQQLEQLLGSSEVNRQRQAHASSGPLAAAAAAAFIAWVHQPADLQRQSSLMQRLLSAISTAASSSSSSGGGGGGGSGGGGGNAMQQGQPDLNQAANCLLNAWTATLKGQQQQQQQSVTTGSCHCSGMSVTPALYMCDLPCAVLQQKQLLLGCTPGQLVSMCIEAASSDLQQQQQQQSGKQCGVAGSTAAAGVFPVEVQCQLLDCSNDLCAAALEVVNFMVQHKTRPPSQLQQQQGSNAAAASFSSAAASLSCLARQWLEDNDAAASITDHSNMVHQGSGTSSIVPDLAVAKRLLAAATGVDQQLKQYAQGHVAT